MTELRERMIHDMKIRGLSQSTIKAYVYHVSKIAKHYNKSPALLKIHEIKKYLVYLKDEKKFSFSSRNQLVAALNFLYSTTLNDKTRLLSIPRRKKPPPRLPVVLSREEVKKIITAPKNMKHRLLLKTAYSAGLRVSELVRLRPEHIDSKRMLIYIKQGKGQKDRYTILSQKLLDDLRTYYLQYRPGQWLFAGQSPDQHLSEAAARMAFSFAKKKPVSKKAMASMY